jgi:hypothetical protein
VLAKLSHTPPFRHCRRSQFPNMLSQIRIGCRVSAAVGPYIPISLEQQRAFAEKQWTVYWEEVQKAADHFGQSLKFERKATAQGLAGLLDLESILNHNYVKDLTGLDRAWATLGRQDQRESPGTPAATVGTTVENVCPPVVAVATAITAPIPPLPMASTTQAITQNDHDIPPTATADTTPGVSAPEQAPPATTTAPVEIQDGDSSSLLLAHANNHQDPNPVQPPVDPSEQDPDSALDEDPYDPQSVLEDFLEDLADGRHTHQFQLYLSNKQELIGTDALVGRCNKVLNWKVQDDVLKDEVPADKEFDKVGICNFDFANTTVPSTSLGDPQEKKSTYSPFLFTCGQATGNSS